MYNLESWNNKLCYDFQAFLFPFHNNGAVLRVVKVYKDWFQVGGPNVDYQ